MMKLLGQEGTNRGAGMTTTRAQYPLSLGRKMQPTTKHRPAIWEMLLGTVEAMNDAGEVRYFDYDYDAAVAFAGVEEEGRDPRLARARQGSNFHDRHWIDKGQLVLYVRKGM